MKSPSMNISTKIILSATFSVFLNKMKLYFPIYPSLSIHNQYTGGDFMPNPIHLTPAQTEALIQSLAQQLHCDPNTLRQQLQSGNIGGIANSMGGDAARQVQQLLKNPQQLQQAMNSPEMKELLRRIQGQK